MLACLIILKYFLVGTDHWGGLKVCCCWIAALQAAGSCVDAINVIIVVRGVGGSESLVIRIIRIESFKSRVMSTAAMARNCADTSFDLSHSRRETMKLLAPSFLLAFLWPTMTIAGFASRMGVSRSLKSALPEVSLIPISIGDDDTVTEATNPMLLKDVAIPRAQDKDVSLAFVVRRPG